MTSPSTNGDELSKWNPQVNGETGARFLALLKEGMEEFPVDEGKLPEGGPTYKDILEAALLSAEFAPPGPVFINWSAKAGRWQMREASGPENGGRRALIREASLVLLDDVEMVVSEGGRDYYRRTGRMTLHAGVQGEVIKYSSTPVMVPYHLVDLGAGFLQLRYSPDQDDGWVAPFLDGFKSPVLTHRERVILCPNGQVYASVDDGDEAWLPKTPTRLERFKGWFRRWFLEP